jgi:hypothetical protein
MATLAEPDAPEKSIVPHITYKQLSYKLVQVMHS